MTAPRPQAIDCWLNPAFRPSEYRPEFLVRVAREYFHREKEMFEVTPLETLRRQMDDACVERAILTIDLTGCEDPTGASVVLWGGGDNWTDMGGTVSGSTITVELPHFSIYAVAGN